MKIDKVGRKQTTSVNQKQAPQAVGSKFQSLLGDKKEEQDREHLYAMMKAIKETGEKLADSKNIELLGQYKRMVKSFVSQAVDFAFEIQEKKGLSRFGRSKVLKIVSKIDDQLVEITDAFLLEERSRIKLLGKIGELQGMLLNIFA